MQVHDIIQGSPAWHAYRAEHFNASDAPAMMNASPYKTRTELLKERHTGMAKEINASTQILFDEGHRFEALARALAEEILGEDLYPVTGSVGELSASFDGLTMTQSIAWEHKILNKDIRAAKYAADLGLHYRIQMEQQLLVSGAEKCLFLASKWDDADELVEEVHFWYLPDMELRSQIIAGWAQFEKDLAEYQPKELAEKPKADAIMALPALSILIRGEVASSNLPVFKESAERFIAAIKTDLQTDQDFAVAEATVKFCKEAEDNIALTKDAAIAQTASIDDLMRTLDHIQAQLRDKRLTLDTLVKSQKEVIKTRILSDAKAKFAEHVAGLEAEIKPILLVTQQPDFAGAMKNKRTLASLHDGVDSELANAKIAADAVAKDIRAKRAWCKTNAEGYGFLFSDLQTVIYKPMDDFQMLVNSRIGEHKAAEAAKLEAERARIAEEERIKAEAKAKAEADQEKPQQAAHQPAQQPEVAQAEPEQSSPEKRVALSGGCAGTTTAMVTIPKAEYARLKADSELLECLRSAGVDNWEGYGEALELFEQKAA